MTKEQKILLHSFLMEFCLQSVQIDPESILTKADEQEVGKRIMTGQLAISDFINWIVGVEDELMEGTKLFLGSLIKQNLDYLNKVSEEAMKRGQPLPQEFYDRKEELQTLTKEFPPPDGMKEPSRIIMP